MLVKLYELDLDWGFVAEQAALGITVRKPIGPEKHLLVDWVREHFSGAWASETDCAVSNTPTSVFVAIQQGPPPGEGTLSSDGTLIGFGCYDATALGFFGPVGVLEPHRGRGTGRALLLACLLDMKLKGYGYAVIGAVGPADFYRKTVGAVEIPGSAPGLWKTWIKR
jgi:hypothetical protein